MSRPLGGQFPTAGKHIPGAWEQHSRPVGNAVPCAGLHCGNCPRIDVVCNGTGSVGLTSGSSPVLERMEWESVRDVGRYGLGLSRLFPNVIDESERWMVCGCRVCLLRFNLPCSVVINREEDISMGWGGGDFCEIKRAGRPNASHPAPLSTDVCPAHHPDGTVRSPVA